MNKPHNDNNPKMHNDAVITGLLTAAILATWENNHAVAPEKLNESFSCGPYKVHNWQVTANWHDALQTATAIADMKQMEIPTPSVITSGEHSA